MRVRLSAWGQGPVTAAKMSFRSTILSQMMQVAEEQSVELPQTSFYSA
jgi:hypothetical protein